MCYPAAGEPESELTQLAEGRTNSITSDTEPVIVSQREYMFLSSVYVDTWFLTSPFFKLLQFRFLWIDVSVISTGHTSFQSKAPNYWWTLSLQYSVCYFRKLFYSFYLTLFQENKDELTAGKPDSHRLLLELILNCFVTNQKLLYRICRNFDLFCSYTKTVSSSSGTTTVVVVEIVVIFSGLDLKPLRLCSVKMWVPHINLMFVTFSVNTITWNHNWTPLVFLFSFSVWVYVCTMYTVLY